MRGSSAAVQHGARSKSSTFAFDQTELIESPRVAGGAGGTRTHDRRIMGSMASCIVRASCTDLPRWSSSSCRAAGGQLAPAWLYVTRIEQTPHRLACHLGDQVIVAVDVQHLGTVQFGGRGDD